MKRLTLLTLFFIVILGLSATNVTLREATDTAINWYSNATNQPVQQNIISHCDSITNPTNSEQVDWYVVEFTQGGFILISGDDKAAPILGYSLSDAFIESNIPDNLSWWLSEYHTQINILRSSPAITTHPDWSQIRRGDFTGFLPNRSVSPLLTTNWDQGWPYNSMCPTANGGPGGHVYVGCVALAMAEVMKFWAYPTHGNGSHTYTHATYGSQTANFGATTYNWSSMPNALYNSPNTNISTIMYHCAVSVNMDFAPNGSGAQSSDARNAFINYFNFEPSAQLSWKSSYPNSVDWDTLIRTELDAHRPVFYCGADVSAGGHAWVCDGYQGTNYFHMNWGWSGQGNGYFYLNNLNPNPYNFSTQQGAIHHIQPMATPTPPTSLTATVSDGSNVLLQWSAPATRALLGYSIYKNGVLFDTTTDPSNTTYFDINVSPGTYYYYVVANFSQADSAPSNTAVATIYPPPVVNYLDGFEDMADFSIDLSPWFLYDIDASNTITFTGHDYPNAGINSGFMVFNPSATTPPIADFTPHGGQKVAACFAAQNPPNNDWLVSPQWNTGSLAKLHFWARTYNDESTPELIKVGITTGTPDPAGMTIISGTDPIQVPHEWTEFQFDLDTYHFMNIFAGIECVTNNGYLLMIDDVQLWSSQVANEDNAAPAVNNLKLICSPNPFNATTSFSWNQKKSGSVSLKVYDLKGRLIRTIKEGNQSSGNSSITWNGKDDRGNTVATGVYTARLVDNEGHSAVAKMMMIK